MIFPPVPSQRRDGCARASCRAFTLIELLAVITIILILAGLILNIAGSAQYKAAMSRANAEIQQMSTAMENYKVDNGAYPQGPAVTSTTSPPPQTSTDLLNAQTDTDPQGGASNARYVAACTYLFQQLSGNTELAASNPTTSMSKVYITFTPGQLSTTNATLSSATYLVDPFGFPYGYSTANAYATQWTPTTATAQGYNPTFDLWSTGGYATGGKTYPTASTGTQQAFDATLWAKNW